MKFGFIEKLADMPEELLLGSSDFLDNSSLANLHNTNRFFYTLCSPGLDIRRLLNRLNKSVKSIMHQLSEIEAAQSLINEELTPEYIDKHLALYYKLHSLLIQAIFSQQWFTRDSINIGKELQEKITIVKEKFGEIFYPLQEQDYLLINEALKESKGIIGGEVTGEALTFTKKATRSGRCTIL